MLGSVVKLVAAKFDGKRGELRRASAALASARQEEAELEAKLGRLRAVVADAEAADAAFHKAVAADDDGAALADFAEGKAPDGAIGKLVERAQTTAAAAVAARAAAPKVQGRLDELREQIGSADHGGLEYKKKQVLLAYLRDRASSTFQQYQHPWNALCRAYDEIVGIRRALEYGGPIEPLQGPRFDDPQYRTTKHTSGGEIARQIQAKWEEARTRLDADPDAAIDDLIGPAAEKDTAYYDDRL
jgi:hypothetical protein